MMASEHMGLGFADKRNRNPNWTDHEIIRFLEILQEEKVLKDLLAQRNKQVCMYVLCKIFLLLESVSRKVKYKKNFIL